MNILVTGASGDIGRQVVKDLTAEGHQVAVHYHQAKAKAEKLAKEVGGLSVGADLTSPIKTKKMIQGLLKSWGVIEGFVHVAGFPINAKTRHYWESAFEDVTPQMMRQVFDVDTLGAVHCLQALLPAMKKKMFGRIVLFGSASGVIAHEQGYPFNMAKAALINMAKGLALEVGPFGITVNVVAPCAIETHWMDLYPPSFRRKMAEKIPAARLGKPKDVSSLVKFLISPEAEWLTGKVYIVDGGEVRT